MMTTSIINRFLDHYCERLQYNWLDFLLTNNVDTIRVLYHISVVFFLILSTQKSTPMMVTPPTCQVSSNSFQWFNL